jgi:hypothetical protein
MHGALTLGGRAAGGQPGFAACGIGEFRRRFVDMGRMYPAPGSAHAGELIAQHHRGKIQVMDHQIPDD